MRILSWLVPLLTVVPGCAAGSLRHAQLEKEISALVAGFDGRVGVCVADAAGRTCIHGEDRFPMQSVMKLLAGVAVLDAVDRGGTRLDEPVLVRRQDLSVGVQPLARLVGPAGYRTTVGDLVRRAVVDSDSAAVDILVARLGGPGAVQACLVRKGFGALRFDRDERHLQTEVFGLTWRPELVDAERFERDLDQVPRARREQAYRAYQADVRDTATPRAMAALLLELAGGRLLGAPTSGFLLDVLRQTVTFPDRLKAGVPPGWTLGHKTGTSNTWAGVTAATNDVGVLGAPDGGAVAIAVFIADSAAPAAARAALMARLAAVAAACYKAER